MTLNTAKKTALIFFITGTVLFLIQLVTKSEIAFAFFGFVFILIALVYNLIVLIILIVQLIKHNELDTFFSIVIILLNIPIAVGYAYILIHFS
jgi:hypothetical protein